MQIDELVASCALGNLPKSLDVLIKSHIELKPAANAFFQALEKSAASELLNLSFVGKVDSRVRRLEDIFAADDVQIKYETSKHLQKNSEYQQDETLPFALREYIGKPLKDVAWRWRMPGLKEYRIESAYGYEASLLWIKAGRKMPSHTHDGLEATLVLKGSFGDEHEHYARGDVSLADCDIDHSPKAGTEEDCICLMVTNAPLRLTGRLGHFFSKIFS